MIISYKILRCSNWNQIRTIFFFWINDEFSNQYISLGNITVKELQEISLSLTIITLKEWDIFFFPMILELIRNSPARTT